VVPNFVAQDGDPRGDGWGGPGWSIRDEINPIRYAASTVGMALSGPDTGGSQWFITLIPQPSLDGIYTVFGRVVDDQGTLIRLTQGDVIKSIHR
jgi:cyclophilin family peptidyl-prolyl cis-trans isomerase